MTTFPIYVNAWQRDPTVSFDGTGISESILVDPRANPSNPSAYADTLHATALARRAGGQRVVYRPWFNLSEWGDQPWPFYSPNNRGDANAWPNILAPFESPTLPGTLTAWWDGFNAQTVANGVSPDYCMLDNEKRASFYYFETQAAREAYFTPVTVEGYTNPALSNPSLYTGKAIWNYSVPETDFFIQENEQSAAERLTVVLTRLHLGVFSSAQIVQYQVDYEQRFGSLPESDLVIAPISNYNDQVGAFTYGDVQGRPNRLPYAQTRIAHISAPIAYINRRILPLFAAEPEYTTSRQIANRQRWKSIIHRINQLRSCAAVDPGEVHPWIQAPGWGWNGTEGWANTTQLPFELLLWRRFMAHLEAMGIDTYNLWNPIPSSPGTNDPNSPTTHSFVAAYFTGREVPALRRDLTEISLDSDTITTGSETLTYSEIFEISKLYFVRSADNPVPFMSGSGTLADPLVVSLGATGDAEVAAMKAAIQSNQGNKIQTEEAGTSGLSVLLVRQGTTEPVADPTEISGQVGDIITLVVAARNISGSTVNSLTLSPGTGVSAQWHNDASPLTIPNNVQQNILLTFDTSIVRTAFDTTFQFLCSGDDPVMNIRMNITAASGSAPADVTGFRHRTDHINGGVPCRTPELAVDFDEDHFCFDVERKLDGTNDNTAVPLGRALSTCLAQTAGDLADMQAAGFSVLGPFNTIQDLSSTLEPGQGYSYRVRPVDAEGVAGNWSTWLSGVSVSEMGVASIDALFDDPDYDVAPHIPISRSGSSTPFPSHRIGVLHLMSWNGDTDGARIRNMGLATDGSGTYDMARWFVNHVDTLGELGQRALHIFRGPWGANLFSEDDQGTAFGIWNMPGGVNVDGDPQITGLMTPAEMIRRHGHQSTTFSQVGTVGSGAFGASNYLVSWMDEIPARVAAGHAIQVYMAAPPRNAVSDDWLATIKSPLVAGIPLATGVSIAMDTFSSLRRDETEVLAGLEQVNPAWLMLEHLRSLGYQVGWEPPTRRQNNPDIGGVNKGPDFIHSTTNNDGFGSSRWQLFQRLAGGEDPTDFPSLDEMLTADETRIGYACAWLQLAGIVPLDVDTPEDNQKRTLSTVDDLRDYAVEMLTSSEPRLFPVIMSHVSALQMWSGMSSGQKSELISLAEVDMTASIVIVGYADGAVYDFGDEILQGQNPSIQLTLQNEGNSTATIDSIVAGGDALVSPADNPSGLTIAPGATRTLTLVLDATVDGAKFGLTTISYSWADGQEVDEVSIGISGTVIEAPVGVLRTVPLGTAPKPYRIVAAAVSDSNGISRTGQVRIAVRRASDARVVYSGLTVDLDATTHARELAATPYTGGAGDVILAEILSMSPDGVGIEASVDCQPVLA